MKKEMNIIMIVLSNNAIAGAPFFWQLWPAGQLFGQVWQVVGSKLQVHSPFLSLQTFFAFSPHFIVYPSQSERKQKIFFIFNNEGLWYGTAKASSISPRAKLVCHI